MMYVHSSAVEATAEEVDVRITVRRSRIMSEDPHVTARELRLFAEDVIGFAAKHAEERSVQEVAR